MPATTPGYDQELALIVLQSGRPQQELAKFLNLVFNYQYGLPIVVAPNLGKAASLLAEHGPSVRCVAVIQDGQVTSPVTLRALGRQGEAALFLVLPTQQLGPQRMVASGLDCVHFCAWERAFSPGGGSLQSQIGGALEEAGLGNLYRHLERLPYGAMQQLVERRLRHINTLPTLPEIVLRIMRMVNDPKTTPEQLEQVLCTDPAIVMKLLQVMRSPVFTGTAGRSTRFSLKEIITRLGVKKVGAIAQQVKMINSLVRPEESEFDLKRFWEHSVGTAIVADKLVTDGAVRLGRPLDFNDYWIAALLHDVGKLVLGFFFWDWMARLLSHSAERGTSFRQAEIDLGDAAGHPRVGQLMLLHADIGQESVSAVGHHHDVAATDSDLVRLLHVADNLAKAVGLATVAGAEPEFDAEALARLGLSQARVADLVEELQQEMVEPIRTVVSASM